jgi:hypothetical protein
MATPEKDRSLTLTRRRFVQGVAAVGIAAAVEGKFNKTDAEVSCRGRRSSGVRERQSQSR